MASAQNTLFAAFHEDHAVLGRGFYALSQSLRAGDVAGAVRAASELDASAGAHIAFEEEDFYPALAPLLGADEIARMRGDHDIGLGVLRALHATDTQATLEPATRDLLLARVQTMQQHIAECGELFEAIGRIPADEQAKLLERLLAWRRHRPSWLEYSASRESR